MSPELTQILKRLSLIVSLIDSGDVEAILYQVEKLKIEDKTNLTATIVSLLTKADYSKAIVEITDLQNSMRDVIIQLDPEIEALTLEIISLENKLMEVEGELTEAEKIVVEFNHKVHIKLGQLINKIYKLKRDFHYKMRNSKNGESEYKKAKEAYEKFIEDEEAQKSQVFFDLSSVDLKLLKELYRKGVNLCHPDKFLDENQKKAATEVFIKLKDAYERQDLASLTVIISSLESGFLFTNVSQPTTREFLLNKREILKTSLKRKLAELAEYRKSEVFMIVLKYPDITKYVTQKEKELNEEVVYWENKLISI